MQTLFPKLNPNRTSPIACVIRHACEIKNPAKATAVRDKIPRWKGYEAFATRGI